MLNKVIIMGRLTRDPEIKKVNNDISVCSFSIACDRDIVNKQNNERETDFFDVTAWRSTADFVGKRRMTALCTRRFRYREPEFSGIHLLPWKDEPRGSPLLLPRQAFGW